MELLIVAMLLSIGFVVYLFLVGTDGLAVLLSLFILLCLLAGIIGVSRDMASKDKCLASIECAKANRALIKANKRLEDAN